MRDTPQIKKPDRGCIYVIGVLFNKNITGTQIKTLITSLGLRLQREIPDDPDRIPNVGVVVPQGQEEEWAKKLKIYDHVRQTYLTQSCSPAMSTQPSSS